MTSLQDLFLDQLRDLHSVERQLVPALEELASMASNDTLRRSLLRHAQDTRGQKERLEAIGREHGWDLEGDHSKAMEGLIEGGRSHVAEIDHPPARDFLIIAHSHRIEHYELAGYAVTIELAERLGLRDQSSLLRRSREEEQSMDEALTQIATRELLGQIAPE